MVDFAVAPTRIREEIWKNVEEKTGWLEGRKVAHGVPDLTGLYLFIGIVALAILFELGLLAAGISLTTIGAMTANPLMLGFGITLLILFFPSGYGMKSILSDF